MEVKKNPKKDFEKAKGLYLQIGLSIALLFVLVAFEWRTYDKTDDSMFETFVDIPIDEEIEITRPEEIKPQPPPQIPEIKIVDDHVEVDTDLSFDLVYIVDHYVSRIEVAEEVHVEQDIFTVVQEEPKFPGGNEKLFEYLEKNLSFPLMAWESGIEGTVFVTFVVEPDGSITNAEILHGIGGGCDEEAIRVVRNMPRWQPGKQRGKPVRVQFNLPIRFTLK